MVKKPPVVWDTWAQSLGWEDSLEKGTVTHAGILDWRIPWTWGRKESDTTERLSLHYYLCACVLIHLCSVCTRVRVCVHIDTVSGRSCSQLPGQKDGLSLGKTQAGGSGVSHPAGLQFLPSLAASSVLVFCGGCSAPVPIRILPWALWWPELAGDSRLTLMSLKGQEHVDPAGRSRCLGDRLPRTLLAAVP